MKANFEDLPWHDAQVLSVEVDRSQAGYRDEVRLHLIWPDSTKSIVVFTNTYLFEARMNFGVIADETILAVSAHDEGQVIDEVRTLWRRLGVDLSDLTCFELETASSASKLRIFARSFELRSW
jgi:hypothetical protein